MAVSCEKCGNEIIEGAKFCGNCGEKIAVSEDRLIEDGAEIAANSVSAIEKSDETEREAGVNTTAKESSPAAVWFYELKGEKIGPVNEAQIKFLMEAGTISYGTAVWKKGFPEWLNIENTELLELLQKDVPPPIPGTHIDNTLAWVVAFVPLIGAIIEVTLFGQVVSFTFFIYWIVNALLCNTDSRRLAKAGYNTEKFRGWFWLVPVYLFQRATHLKQNYAYFIADIVVLILVVIAS